MENDRIAEWNRLQDQLDVLNQLVPRYGGKTLENIIQNLEALLSEIGKELKPLNTCIEEFTAAHAGDSLEEKDYGKETDCI